MTTYIDCRPTLFFVHMLICYSTIDNTGQLSSCSYREGNVLQGLLEMRLNLELVIQRPDGLLCLLAPAWLYMRVRMMTMNNMETRLY